MKRHSQREVRRARRLSGGRRARVRRHARRHRRQLRRRCLKRYGRTPGRVAGLTARAISGKRIVLTFKAPGSDGSRASRPELPRQAVATADPHHARLPARPLPLQGHVLV